MKALTISQPFASLIANGEKWIENRRWYCGYRGPLAIHAGKGTQYLDREEIKEFVTGAIIAVCDMVGCVKLVSSIEGIRTTVTTPGEVERLEALGFTGERIRNHEHAEGPFCFLLANVRKLDKPIPYRGAQGLFDVYDEFIEEAEKEQ